MTVIRRIVSVRGTVQGVGFRPFVYRLAGLCDLKGRVINTPWGVEIDVEGTPESIARFVRGIRDHHPPLARIDEIVLTDREPAGYSSFTIEASQYAGAAEALVSADVAVCRDCLREMRNPADRRYRYPFINCTDCGPRYTIVRDIPYDRVNTTMRAFAMCPECFREYHDPADRRFHAQPNACPVCGPRVVLRDSAGGLLEETNPVEKACAMLREGAIVAVKGLGGYHLACNALDDRAVGLLRSRKVREEKPFAVMVRDLKQARRYCRVGEDEARLLAAAARPIVLLRKKGGGIAAQVAPGHAFLGLMLPYTPLHYLLFEYFEHPLVMTSGNMSDEPIAYRDDDALLRLGGIADAFLTHNREIYHRCDDSVVRVFGGAPYFVRRARGFAPAPVRLNREMAPILAVGGELKNTFCLTKGRHAFVSHHIGDLENLETLASFEQEVAAYKKLFHIEPELVAYDLHPEYLSTKYALDLPGIRKTGVQHHHAHIAGCMAENGLDGHVLGVAFDGTGFGPDGSVWGGEFLYCSLADFKRVAHLNYVPMPGGARAVREPWRMAAGHLYSVFGWEWRNQAGVPFLAVKNGMLLEAVGEMLEKWVNCPPTSSMGRLFDAVAALLGLRDTVSYEGQAAVELEQLALTAGRRRKQKYGYEITAQGDMLEINTSGIIKEVLHDLRRDEPLNMIALKFHLTVAGMVTETCLRAREMLAENRVCLSGGVFQNMLLLDMVCRSLRRNGFAVFIHRLVPANDGGLSLGQAVIADERRKVGCV